MTLSLRGRLLIGVISLVVLGLLVSSAATYLLFQNSLIARIDGELTSSNTVSAAASWLQNDCRVPPGSSGGFPTYTVAELSVGQIGMRYELWALVALAMLALASARDVAGGPGSRPG